jgi:hypothetical protein
MCLQYPVIDYDKTRYKLNDPSSWYKSVALILIGIL